MLGKISYDWINNLVFKFWRCCLVELDVYILERFDVIEV